MTPILYESTEVDFKNNGLGPLTEIYDVDVAEQRNGLFQLTATYPTNGKLYNNIDIGNIILVKPNPTSKVHAFRIVVSDLDVFAKNLQIEADSITYDLTHNLIKHVVLDGDGQTAMSQLQKATMNPHLFTFSSDILHSSKSELNMVNPMEAIAGTQGSFLQIWGGELKRENRKISMLNRRGRDNVTSFRLGKNISGLKYSIDMSSVVTQIIPYVTKSDSGSENTEYVYGTVVNSKNINNYPNIYLQQVDVSQNITVEETDTDAIITGKINDYAKDWFTKSENTDRDEPKVTVDIDVLSLQDSSDYQDKFKDLEMVELTDTVTVYVPEFKINVTAVVNELHYDPVSERIISLVVGAAKVSFSDANNNTLNDMQNKIDEIHEDANNAVSSANGKNTIYFGKEKPSHPVEGDLWYWTDGENSGLKIFQNGNWVDVLDTNVNQAIEDAQQEAENAKNKANDAVNQANDAVANAGFAKDIADNAKSDAADALSKAGDAYNDAQDAITDAKNALDDVTKLDQTVKTEISNINGQLSQKVSQNTFDELKGTVIKQGTEIDQSKDEIALKANQSTVDTLSGKVSDNSSAISINSNNIALKANQTTVDQVNGTVKQLDAELKVQAGQISSKVSRNDVTGMLSGYATQTWTQSQIKQTADSIDLSVSKVQNNIDSMQIGGRNYIQNSDISIEENSKLNLTISNPPVYFSEKTITISIEVNFDNFKIDSSKINRIGYETSIKYEDGSVQYLNVWINPKDGDSFHGRINKTYVIKKNSIAGFGESALYTQTTSKGSTVGMPKIEIGTKATDWSAAPEDLATVEQYAELQVTLNGIQGTVANKADQSQVTQLANQITSVVTDSSTESVNIIKNGSFNGLIEPWKAEGDVKYQVLKANGVQPFSTNYIRVDTSNKGYISQLIDNPLRLGASDWNFNFYYYVQNSVVGYTKAYIRIDYSDDKPFKYVNNAELIANNKWQKLNIPIKKADVTNVKTFNIRLQFTGASGGAVYYSQIQINKGLTPKPYTENTDNFVTTSQITQLANDINLRVQKGDVINQINVSPESILISANKIHISGSTSIDDAAISSAKIANLSANKITAGTINAANVNLINMNASNITTGTIKGASLSINLLNGNVTFQKGRIYSTSGTIDMNIDEGYLSVTNATGGNKNNVLIRNGEIAFTQPQLFDPSKDPYLRISNKIGESSFNSSTIQARGALELNIKGHESSLIDQMGVQTLAGIKFGIGNSNQLEPTFIGGANVGVIISGGTITNSGLFDASPSISIGTSGGQPTNRITVNAEYFHVPTVFRQTTSSGANVYVAGDGALVRSTSASKYKQNIVRHVDLNDSEKLLNVPLAMWDDKAEVKRTGTSKRYFGMIAEDLASVGLEYLVSRGPNGEIEGIEYSKVALLLIPEFKKLKEELENLKHAN